VPNTGHPTENACNRVQQDITAPSVSFPVYKLGKTTVLWDAVDGSLVGWDWRIQRSSHLSLSGCAKRRRGDGALGACRRGVQVEQVPGKRTQRTQLRETPSLSQKLPGSSTDSPLSMRAVSVCDLCHSSSPGSHLHILMSWGAAWTSPSESPSVSKQIPDRVESIFL
jgi:hypothetical protein